MFAGEAEFRATLKGYGDASGEIYDSAIEPIFVVYSSLIMLSYLYQVGENDPQALVGAQTYHEFLRTYVDGINEYVPNFLPSTTRESRERHKPYGLRPHTLS